MTNHRINVIFFVAFLALFSLLTTVSGKANAAQDVPQTPTPVDGLSFEDIETKYDDLSKKEFEDYFKTIAGTRVHWSAEVIGGDDDYLLLDLSKSIFRGVNLQGISEKEIPKNTQIEFEATIKEYTRFLGFSLHLSNPVILSKIDLLEIPTETPTPTLTPTATPNPELGYKQIEAVYDVLSKSDFEEYFQKIKGNRIRWIAKVSGGSEDSLYLDMDQKILRNIYLEDVSIKDIPEGKYIEFEAKIDKFGRFLGFSLSLKEPAIIQILNTKPTSTPPPTRTPLPPTATFTPTATDTPTLTPTSTPMPVAQFTVSGSANIRSGPGIEFPVAKGALQGEVWPVYGKNADGSWLLIDAINYWWIKTSLGTLDVGVDALPLAPTPLPTNTPTLTPTKTPTLTVTPRPSSTSEPSINLTGIYNSYEK